MDWKAAIETNRQALKRVLASLVAWPASPAARRPPPCRAISTGPCSGCCARPRPRRGGWSSSPRAALSSRLRRRACAAPKVLAGGAPGMAPASPARTTAFNSSTRCRASAGRGGRRGAAFRASAFPACATRFRSAARLADDPVDAVRLTLRLRRWRALDDLPRQARRFARWRAPATPARKISDSTPQMRENITANPAAFAASGRCVPAARPARAPGQPTKSTRFSKPCTASPPGRWSGPTHHDGAGKLRTNGFLKWPDRKRGVASRKRAHFLLPACGEKVPEGRMRGSANVGSICGKRRTTGIDPASITDNFAPPLIRHFVPPSPRNGEKEARAQANQEWWPKARRR
jgi:hypothetical protein